MQHIGQYPVVEELGAGAMGQVFKVQGSEPGEFYALKLLKNLNAEQIQRFQREAKILQFLGRQPNIIGFHDMGADHGRPYIVMEFIRGARTLEELINRREIETPAACRALVKVARALNFAHEAAVIHRDVKPSNILLDEEGQAYLSDFGLARLGDEVLTREGEVLGTPVFMAPEQLRGVPDLDRRCDVYALGVTLYGVLTGRLPFIGKLSEVTRQILTEPVVPPRRHNPEVDPILEVICLKAMSKDREHRYATAEELARALEVAVGDSIEDGPVELPARSGRAGFGLVAVAVLLLLVACGIGVVREWSRARGERIESAWRGVEAALRAGRAPEDEALEAARRASLAKDDPRRVWQPLLKAASLIEQGSLALARAELAAVLPSEPANLVTAWLELESGKLGTALSLLRSSGEAGRPPGAPPVRAPWGLTAERLLEALDSRDDLSPSQRASLGVERARRALAAGRDGAARRLISAALRVERRTACGDGMGLGPKLVPGAVAALAEADSDLQRLTALDALIDARLLGGRPADALRGWIRDKTASRFLTLGATEFRARLGQTSGDLDGESSVQDMTSEPAAERREAHDAVLARLTRATPRTLPWRLLVRALALLRPDCAELQLNLGAELLASGETERAEAVLLGVASTLAEARVALAELALQGERRIDAITRLRSVVQSHGAETLIGARARMLLGFALAESESRASLEQSSKLLRDASGRDSPLGSAERALAWRTRALVMGRLGRPKRQRRALEMADQLQQPRARRRGKRSDERDGSAD